MHVLATALGLSLLGSCGGLLVASSLVLFPADGRTRLLSRNRIATPHAPALTRLVGLLVMEPGSLVMERKMLLGIKERAQRLAAERGQPDPAAAGRT